MAYFKDLLPTPVISRQIEPILSYFFPPHLSEIFFFLFCSPVPGPRARSRIFTILLIIIIIKIIHSDPIHQCREALLQITNIMLLLLYVYRVSELYFIWYRRTGRLK